MSLEHTRHVLVLDVNVYLEVADLLQPPFTWAKFDAHAARGAKEPVPCSSTPAMDSLRVIAMCTSGRFAGGDPVEVWTSAHIDGLVRSKARHPLVPAPGSDKRGLGWCDTHAQSLVDELVRGITRRSNGGTLGEAQFPDGDPPLDHEDGMVYGACRVLAGDDPLSNVFCVTRDRGFLAAYREEKLPRHTRVLSPPQMVALMQAARARLSVQRMRPQQ